MEEIFKKHPYCDYEGSNLGNVRNPNWFNTGKPHIVKQSITAKGYRLVGIKGKSTYVHKFIYECFNGTIPKDCEIDHINGEPADNRIENLRAVSHSANVHNPITIQRMRTAKSDINNTKIGVRNLNNGIITIYPSLREAEQNIGISRETLRKLIISEKCTTPSKPGLLFFTCKMVEK